LENYLKSRNKLKKVNDFAVILNMLNGAKENNTEVYIWKLVGDKKHLAQVRLESVRKTKRDFAIVPNEGQERSLQDIIGFSRYVDVYLPESSLLFRAAIRTSDPPFRYYLEIPEFVAQLDRRSNLRLILESPSEVKISFQKMMEGPRPISQYFHKDCYDVSTGGFSFYVSKMESKFFGPGDPFELLMRIDRISIKAKSQISVIKEIEPDEFNGLNYKVFRVGCKFTEIDQLAKKYLEKFIFERIKEELRVINE